MKFDEKYVPCEEYCYSYKNSWYPYRVVKNRQVYDYLLLLKRFVEFSKNMSEESMRMYLVRAEYRYFKWFFYHETPHRDIQELPLGNELHILLCA